MSNPTPAERLAALIALHGPISIAQFMAAANAAYYSAGDPFGTAGDFITAPEISQMFGEIIGLWAADRVAHLPALPHYVELGPGRGTLAQDALRAASKTGWTPQVHFVETSAPLRAAQSARVPHAQWHETIDTLPSDAPLIIIANEFFDCLPIQQAVRADDGWHQRCVAHAGDEIFVPILGKRIPEAVIPEHLRDAPVGSILESCPSAMTIVQALCARLIAQGGALLIIDYGYAGPALGETFQALQAHTYANPFENIGVQDLTAHVDFGTLAAAAVGAGCDVAPLATQGEWLIAHGLELRAEALRRAHPERAADISAQLARLTHPAQMGALFKVLEVTAPGSV